MQKLLVIYLLPPYYSNFGKRVVKHSKLYFIDTGIVCALLKINEKHQLEHHPLQGSLFENYCVINLVKQNSYQLTKSNFYFWRSNNGVEVDLITEKGVDLSLIEIKAGSNFHSKWFKNIELFKSYSKITSKQYVIYTGKNHLTYGEHQAIIPYEKMNSIFK